MSDCWRFICRHDKPGWSEIPCWCLDNTTDNPAINKPGYIPGEVCHPYAWHYQADGNIPRIEWTTYCTPPTTPFQITTKSILDTPLSNARQWSATGGLFLDRGFILACRCASIPISALGSASSGAIATQTLSVGTHSICPYPIDINR